MQRDVILGAMSQRGGQARRVSTWKMLAATWSLLNRAWPRWRYAVAYFEGAFDPDTNELSSM